MILLFLISAAITAGTIVHIEYQPSLLEPLPRSMCVSGRCVIPHYDIQGHSASVDWYVNGTQILQVDVNTTALWKFLIDLSNVSECFTLLNTEKEDEDNSDIEDEDFEISRKCIRVLPEIEENRIIKFIRMKLNDFPIINKLIIGFKETIYDITRLDITTWSLFIVSVISVQLVFRRAIKRRPTGLVRISYTDPRKVTEYITLPSKEYPKEKLSEEAIFEKLLDSSGYSSFTVLTCHSS